MPWPRGFQVTSPKAGASLDEAVSRLCTAPHPMVSGETPAEAHKGTRRALDSLPVGPQDRMSLPPTRSLGDVGWGPG